MHIFIPKKGKYSKQAKHIARKSLVIRNTETDIATPAERCIIFLVAVILLQRAKRRACLGERPLPIAPQPKHKSCNDSGGHLPNQHCIMELSTRSLLPL